MIPEQAKLEIRNRRAAGGDVDWDSELDRGRIWNCSTSVNDSTLARQRGLGAGRRNTLARR